VIISYPKHAVEFYTDSGAIFWQFNFVLSTIELICLFISMFSKIEEDFYDGDFKRFILFSFEKFGSDAHVWDTKGECVYSWQCATSIAAAIRLNTLLSIGTRKSGVGRRRAASYTSD